VTASAATLEWVARRAMGVGFPFDDAHQEAALVVLDGAGRCQDIRLALGGAAPTPIRAEGAERTLRGETLTDAAVRAAADVAAQQADPLTDLMGSADYRREMIRVWVRRLMIRLRDAGR